MKKEIQSKTETAFEEWNLSSPWTTRAAALHVRLLLTSAVILLLLWWSILADQFFLENNRDFVGSSQREKNKSFLSRSSKKSVFSQAAPNIFI